MNYQRIYDQLIERSRQRIPEGYVERHHVIPKCMGGDDRNSNLVALTPEEHFLAHVLLVKIHPEERNLILAVGYMCSGSYSNQRKRRKLYGWLRRKNSKRMGEVLAKKGSFYITNGKKNKRVFSKEEIPTGWRVGMTSKNDRTKMIYINNGVDTKQINKGSNIPEGWSKGNLSRMNSCWVNDGTVSKYVKVDAIPDGFVRGRI